MSDKSNNVISQFMYVVLMDNTVYTTTHIRFEGNNLVFSAFDDKGTVVNKTFNRTLVDSIRSSI